MTMGFNFTEFGFGALLGAIVGLGSGFLFLSFKGASVNFDDVLQTINRIVGSKKVLLMMVPTIASVLSGILGYDVTSKLNLVIDGAFTFLTMIQGALDFKHGSVSDGTVKKTEETKTTVVEEAKTEQPALVVAK